MDERRRWFDRSRYGEPVKLLLMFVGFPALIWFLGRLVCWILGIRLDPTPWSSY